VGWVGTYEDIVEGREGQYRVRLMKNHKEFDCAYPGVEILPERITKATEALAGKYESVIVEGVGGLHVPLSDTMTVLDYLATKKYPTVLVTSSRLGSINHTLMSLELLQSRGIPLAGLVYNRFGEEDEEIGNDSRTVFERALKENQYPVNIVDLWSLDEDSSETPDFSALCMPEMG
jgi:dethiobiotin synthetase